MYEFALGKKEGGNSYLMLIVPLKASCLIWSDTMHSTPMYITPTHKPLIKELNNFVGFLHEKRLWAVGMWCNLDFVQNDFNLSDGHLKDLK